ncbi:MAG: hypothetical protein Q8P67_19625 [archaeon]|nr:hypothetical protein [archaeon]
MSAALELLLKGSQDDQWKDAGDRKAAATPMAAVLPDNTKQPSPALPTAPAVAAAATDVPVAANASEATDNVVHVWGLPWRVTREEIRDFFSGLSLHADDSANICIEVDENGKRTGDGFVRFADADTTRRSLGRHCKYMGHRYICVELGSQERMQHALRMSDPTKFPPELPPGPSPASSIPSPVVDPTWAPPRDTQKPKNNGHTVGAATTIAITPPGQQFAPQFLGPTNGGAGPPVTSNAPAPAVPFSWDAAHTYAEASQRASGTHPGSARQPAPPAQHPSAPSAINPAPSAVTHASSPFPFPSAPPDPNQAASRFSFVPFRTSNTLDPLFGSVFDPQFPSPSPALYSPFSPGSELDASFVPARSATDSLSWLTSNGFGPLDSRQSGLPPIGGLSDGVSGDPTSFPASNEFLHFGSFQPSPLGSLRELSASAVPTGSVGRSPRQSLALPGSSAALQPIGHPSSSSSASNSPSFDALGPGGFFDFASPSLLQVTPDPELSPHRAASPSAPTSPSSLLPTPGFSSLTPAFLSSWSPLPSSEKPPFTGW